MSLLNFWTLPGPLWADMSKFRNMGSQFRGPRAQVETDEIITGAILMLGLVVVIYILWRLASRHERQGAYDSPRRLFQQLCKAHALDRPRRGLLKRMARWYRLAHPAQLFLESDRFEAANLGPEFVGEMAAVAQLRQVLFSDAGSLGNSSEPTTSRHVAPGAKTTNSASEARVGAVMPRAEIPVEAEQHA